MELNWMLVILMLHVQVPGEVERVDTISLDFQNQVACQWVGADLFKELKLRLGDEWTVRAACIDRGRGVIWDAMP